MKAIPPPTFKIISCVFFSILFLLFCCLPSVVLPQLKEPTQSGKFLVFSIFTALLMVFYSLGLFKRDILSFNLPDVSLLVLLMYIAFNKYIMQETAGFSVQFKELLGLALVYMFLRQFHARGFFLLFIAITIAGSIQAIYGTLQLHGLMASNHSLFDITGSFFNPGPYAGYLASVFPITLGIYLYKNRLLNGEESILPPLFKMPFWSNGIYYFAFFGVIVILLILPATFSRAAWLAVIISSAYLAFNRFNVKYHIMKYLNTPLRKILVITSLALLFIVMATGIYTLKRGSGNGRLFI